VGREREGAARPRGAAAVGRWEERERGEERSTRAAGLAGSGILGRHSEVSTEFHRP